MNLVLRGDEIFERRILKCRGGRLDVEFGGDRLHHEHGVVWFLGDVRAGALRLALWNKALPIDITRQAHRAGRLAEHSDVVGVPTEIRDVVPNPFQGEDLIEKPSVGRDGRILQVTEPFHPEPVVEADQHHAVTGERGAAVCGPGRRAA